MHIALDISPLKNGHAQRGTGVYTALLKKSLIENSSIHDFIFIENKAKLDRYDIVHYPYFEPFFLTLPQKKETTTIVTIHDLIPIEYPQHFPVGIRGKYKWLLQKHSLHSVNQIITDSFSSKRAICKLLPFLESKISVIYLAANPIFFEKRNIKDYSIIKRKYALPNNFLLYVGDINWNKNIIGIINSFSKLITFSSYGDYHLCLVGKAFIDYQINEARVINKLIQDLHIGHKVIFTGYIPDEELKIVYALSKCYIQLSFSEGFGFPILEAMACGCPTIVSNTSSLQEIAGPSILVNPLDIDSIVSGMHKVLKKRYTNSDRQVFINWSKSYSWKKVAKETIAVYEKVFTRSH